MIRQYFDKVFWFCPVCGGNATLWRDLQYQKSLNCTNKNCNATTELKQMPYVAVRQDPTPLTDAGWSATKLD